MATMQLLATTGSVLATDLAPGMRLRIDGMSLDVLSTSSDWSQGVRTVITREARGDHTVRLTIAALARLHVSTSTVTSPHHVEASSLCRAA